MARVEWWWWWWGVPPDRGFSLKVSVCGLWGRFKPASLSLANYHAAFVVRLWCIRGSLEKRGRAVPIWRTKRNCVRVLEVGFGGVGGGCAHWQIFGPLHSGGIQILSLVVVGGGMGG